MADRSLEEIRAHHRRLADGLAGVRIREDYPVLAKYPDLVNGVIEVAEQEEWRKNRCFDHFGIRAGARTPDGKAGWTLCFYGSPDENTAPVTMVTLTGLEYDELLEQMQRARGIRDNQ